MPQDSTRVARSTRGTLGSSLRVIARLSLVGVFCLPRSAHANGRYPKADQLLVAPDAPESIVVRTTFGILVSRDSGRNWDWICERAVGYSGVQDPTIGLMAQGTIVASLSEGIARSEDGGCNWAFSAAPLSGSPVIDLSVRQAEPRQAVALVWDAQRVGYSSRILLSDDEGRSFHPYGNPIDSSVLVTTLDTAPTNPHRVYASGTRSAEGVRSAFLFRSDDDGEHWNEYQLPFDPKLEQGVYIAAVAPQDADTVYVRTSSATVGRLLVSHDGGGRFAVAYSGSLLSFALSPDGKRLYLGGEDGLYSGLTSNLSFEPRARVRVLCLAATADTLYACSDEHSGFTVGASRDGGFAFEPLLHLKTVRGPLACNASECEGDWPLVRTQLGIPDGDESDAGADNGDAGATSGSSTGNAGSSDAGLEGEAGRSSQRPQLTPKSSACAFDPPRPHHSSVVEAWLAIGSLLLSLRHRSRERSRPPAK